MPGKILLNITKSCDASGKIKLHVMPLKIEIFLSISVTVTEHNNNDVLSTRLTCSSDDK